MPVPHARATAVTSTDEQASGKVPGLLEVLARVRTRAGSGAAAIGWRSCSRSR